MDTTNFFPALCARRVSPTFNSFRRHWSETTELTGMHCFPPQSSLPCPPTCSEWLAAAAGINRSVSACVCGMSVSCSHWCGRAKGGSVFFRRVTHQIHLRPRGADWTRSSDEDQTQHRSRTVRQMLPQQIRLGQRYSTIASQLLLESYVALSSSSIANSAVYWYKCKKNLTV